MSSLVGRDMSPVFMGFCYVYGFVVYMRALGIVNGEQETGLHLIVCLLEGRDES